MTSTVLAYIPSPSQGVWHLGPFPLRAYALFIIAGIVAALVLGDRRWVARGGEPGVIYDIALWAVPFGLIGGRLYHVITDWRTYFGDDGAGFAAALRIWDGGLGIWGAVALGGIGAWIACRRRDIPLPAFGDAIAPGIILAQAIGRLGNYFNQELYGRETTLPWGLEIYERVNSAGVPDSLNGVSTGELIQVVHPTFLYELLWNLLVFAALLVIDRRFRIGHGRLFAMYVAGYCVGRFWIELMRSDAATHLAGIRVNSFTSTFVFIGAVVYIMVAPKGREDPVLLRGKQDGDESHAEDLVKSAAVGAATSGVVAAATVAAADDDEKSVAQAAEDDADQTDVLVGREADLETVESDVKPDAGLGSVEGDEAAEAVDGAAEAHAVAVAGEEAAEALVEDSADEPESEADAAEALTDGPAAEAPEREAGLGSVEGDEAAEAVDGAAEAHAVAVEGEEAAEALVEDSADEPESEADAVVVEGDDAAEALTDGPAAEAPEREAGLGSVEGDEAAEAVDGAAEAHAVAVEGEAAAEALTEEPEASLEDAGEPEPEAGLGSVEPDEIADAVGDADDAHNVAVEGEEAAEALVEEDEPESEADEAVEESAQADPADEGTDAAEALAGTDTESSDEPTADSADDAAAAVEGSDAAEALSADPTPATPPSSTPVPPRETRTPTTIPAEVGQRVRQWIRQRRNR